MDSTPELTDLLRYARLQLRMRRARDGMVAAAFALAGVTLVAAAFHRPHAGFFLLPLVPLVGMIAFLRSGMSDGAVAQLLDEQMQTRELLASGISCRGKRDDASRMIIAQADARAAQFDRKSLKPSSHIRRSEAAAGLLLVMALLLTAGFDSSVSTATEGLRSKTTESRRVDHRRDVGTNSSMRPAAEQFNRSAERPGADAVNTAARQRSARESTNRPSTDAGGGGQIELSSRIESMHPPAHAKDVQTSESGLTSSTGTGITAAEGNAKGAAQAGIAPRKPLSRDEATSPTVAARRRAQVALDAEQIDVDARDLVRAFFDLDAPR